MIAEGFGGRVRSPGVENSAFSKSLFFGYGQFWSVYIQKEIIFGNSFLLSIIFGTVFLFVARTATCNRALAVVPWLVFCKSNDITVIS